MPKVKMSSDTTDSDLACEGCGMVDPCGIHYEDCKLLEPGDWVVSRGFNGYREDGARRATAADVRRAKKRRR